MKDPKRGGLEAGREFYKYEEQSREGRSKEEIREGVKGQKGKAKENVGRDVEEGIRGVRQ